jgi:hypothetical protein
MEASPFSSIADRDERFDRDLNNRHGDIRSQNFMQNALNTGNQQLNHLINDRFEIESIRQEQGQFKQKLESIRNDLQVMRHLQEYGKT